jgi:hypothetical protein
MPLAHLHERQDEQQGVVQAAGGARRRHRLHHSVQRVAQNVGGEAPGGAGCVQG